MNNEVCIADQECFSFRKNNVFQWDEAEGRPIVADLYPRVVFFEGELWTKLAARISEPMIQVSDQ